MRPYVLAAAATIAFAAPALAETSPAWEPCLTAEPVMESLIGAFQAEGWTLPASNEEHVDNLGTVGEALYAMQMLPEVQTGKAFDLHIARAHEGAEERLMESPSLSRDGLVLAIQVYDTAGGMVRCTIAGTEFAEVSDALESGAAHISSSKGHDTLMIPAEVSTGRADVTFYRVEAPADATVQARGPLAAVVTRHLQ